MTTLQNLLDLLNEKIDLDTSNILLEYDGKIIFERYPDNDDEDEIILNEKKLQRSLNMLKLKSTCLLFLQENGENNFEI